jgi:hypothetical protein
MFDMAAMTSFAEVVLKQTKETSSAILSIGRITSKRSSSNLGGALLTCSFYEGSIKAGVNWIEQDMF